MIGAILLGAVLSLNGDWSARFWPTPALGPVRELVAIPGSAQSIPGKVPGCIELDLAAAGLVPDLLFSTNSNFNKCFFHIILCNISSIFFCCKYCCFL